VTFFALENSGGNSQLFNISASADGAPSRSQFTSTFVERVEGNEAQPNLVVASVNIPNSSGINQRFNMAVTLTNTGGAAARDVVMTVGPGMGMNLMTVNPLQLDTLAPGESHTFQFSFMATQGAPTGEQFNAISINFTHQGGTPRSLTSGLIVSNPQGQQQPANVMPVVIIHDHSYGEESPAAGSPFVFTLELRNTHPTAAVRDLRITIGGGSATFSPQRGSSTLFVDDLPAGQTIKVEIELVVSASASPTPHGLTVSFIYRNSQNDELLHPITDTINIPIRQDLRFHMSEPPTQSIDMGDEAFVRIEFGNLGRGTIYNVRMRLVSDEFFDSEGGSLMIGNLMPGQTQTRNMFLTPFMPGFLTGMIRFDYEDSNGNEFYSELPLALMVSGDGDGGRFPGGERDPRDMWAHLFEMAPEGYEPLFDENGFPVFDEETWEPVFVPIGSGGNGEEESGFFARLFDFEEMELMQWLVFGGAAVVLLAGIITPIAVVRRKRMNALDADDADL
jgi:hypothetical protein